MQKLLQFGLIAITSLSILACSKTVGSHASDERQRLARLHSKLSFEFMLNENINVAQGEAEEALRLDPTGVEANHAMARVQQLLNNDQQSIHHFERALKTDPFNVVVLNDYGQYLCSKGKIDLALSKFNRAGGQLMNSQRMVSYTRAAACSINNQNFDSAQQYLLKALELNPESKAVLLNLVRINIENNQYAKANTYLKQYMKIETKPSAEALKLAQQIQSKI